MRLNRLEKALMNNPVRALMQWRFPTRRLHGMVGPVRGAVLEVGCGRGIGTDIIFDLFGAQRVDGFDLDPHMVALARKQLASRGERIKLWVGDVTEIPSPDDAYDAVFDFGIIHHAPNWRQALAEIHRVLKPGGCFYAEEVLRTFIVNPVVSRLLDHPLTDRFDHEQFQGGLRRQGFSVMSQRHLGGWFGWYVAQKPGGPS